MTKLEPRRPAGVTALAGFFVFGALVSSLTAAALLTPGGPLDAMWRLNPQAHQDFQSVGPWAIALMAIVCLACAASAAGLWIGARWGRRTALAVLATNAIGDAGNAILRSDLRSLIGLPIAGAMIAYLLSSRVKTYFR